MVFRKLSSTSVRAFGSRIAAADNKWSTRIIVAAAIIEMLDALDLQYSIGGKD
jgi:hypothetical protein